MNLLLNFKSIKLHYVDPPLAHFLLHLTFCNLKLQKDHYLNPPL
jgi:hypothetical protein